MYVVDVYRLGGGMISTDHRNLAEAMRDAKLSNGSAPAVVWKRASVTPPGFKSVYVPFRVVVEGKLFVASGAALGQRRRNGSAVGSRHVRRSVGAPRPSAAPDAVEGKSR